VPLFWTFREGHTCTGATVHFMEEKMDRGAILAQESVAVPDGIRYEQLEAECAQLGGLLLARAAWDLFKGSAQPMPQDEMKSSYHTFPTQADFIVYPYEWGARHLYNFMCGISAWEEPVELQLASEHIFAHGAISYDLHEPDQLPEPAAVGTIVPCRDGHVRVLVI
jgi:methionyl-tRNA formyltransferase